MVGAQSLRTWIFFDIEPVFYKVLNHDLGVIFSQSLRGLDCGRI